MDDLFDFEDLDICGPMLCPRFERLAKFFGMKTDGLIYRTLRDPFSQYKLLVKDDEPGADWLLVSDKEFITAYLALYVDRVYVPGFYHSLNAKYPDFQKAVIMLDARFDQVFPRVQNSVDKPEEIQMRDEDSTKCTLDDNVNKYINELRLSASSFMMGDIYSDYRNHYKAYNNRVGEMVSIVKLVSNDVVIHAPGDGVGVVALACRILGRVCISTEPNDICYKALNIGLIASQCDIDQHISKYGKDGIYVLSNLSRFINLPRYASQLKAIIYDVSRHRYPGYTLLDDNGVLQTNYPEVVSMDQSRIVVQEVRSPDISTIVGPKLRAKNDDEIIIMELERSGKYDKKSEYEAVLTRMDVVTGFEFILADRKFANAQPYREGVIQSNGGFIHRRTEGVNTVYSPSGMTKVTYSSIVNSGGILSKEYDMGMHNVVQCELNFFPGRIRFAYSLGNVVPVEVVTALHTPQNTWSVTITRVYVKSNKQNRYVSAKSIDTQVDPVSINAKLDNFVSSEMRNSLVSSKGAVHKCSNLGKDEIASNKKKKMKNDKTSDGSTRRSEGTPEQQISKMDIDRIKNKKSKKKKK